jgi:hypothetical protein
MRNGGKGYQGTLSDRAGRVVKPDVKLLFLLLALEKIAIDTVVWVTLRGPNLPNRSQQDQEHEP